MSSIISSNDTHEFVFQLNRTADLETKYIGLVGIPEMTLPWILYIILFFNLF